MLSQMTWKKEMEDPLNPEDWAAMQKLSSSVSYFSPSARSIVCNSYLILFVLCTIQVPEGNL